MSFWDNHQPQGDFPPMFPPANTGGWQAGQGIEGVITENRSYTFDGDDKPTPIVHLRTDDGNEWSVGCGAHRLLALMFSLRPPVGARIRIVCTGMNGKSKDFDVQVLSAPGAPTPAAAPAAPQQGYAPPPTAAPPAEAYAPPAAPAQPAYTPPPAAPAPAPAAPQQAYAPPPAPAPPAAPPSY